MNAPAKIDRTQALRADVQALINAATAWQSDLASTNNRSSFYSLLAEVKVLQAIDRLWPDWMETEIKETIAAIEDTYGCDLDGYPLDDGPEWNPSRVHPDDPCQRKGFVA